ncbi:MAG: hypothetical protein AAGH15_12160, partial [Myxococcota bacterium]
VAPAVGAIGWPFEQWLFSLPAVLLGFGLGRLVAFAPDLRTLRRSVGAAWLLCAGLALLLAALVPETALYGRRILGGLGLLVLAALLPNVPDRLTRRVAPLMLGVYILHFFVYLWFVKPALCFVELGDSHALRLGVTFPLTMLLVAWLRRTRLRALL